MLMKEFSLLRYGNSTEAHIVAIEDDGNFQTYAKVYEDWRTKELTVEEVGDDYPLLDFNDIQNSTGTDAEKDFVFGKKVTTATTNIANPFKLSTLRSVIELADYERTLQAMQMPRPIGLAQAAIAHRLVVEHESRTAA